MWGIVRTTGQEAIRVEKTLCYPQFTRGVGTPHHAGTHGKFQGQPGVRGMWGPWLRKKWVRRVKKLNFWGLWGIGAIPSHLVSGPGWLGHVDNSPKYEPDKEDFWGEGSELTWPTLGGTVPLGWARPQKSKHEMTANKADWHLPPSPELLHRSYLPITTLPYYELPFEGQVQSQTYIKILSDACPPVPTEFNPKFSFFHSRSLNSP